MLLADRYIDRIDFLKYLPNIDCSGCGVKTCEEFVDGLKRKELKVSDCPGIEKSLHYPFKIALDADNLLPQFSCSSMPQPGPTGLIEINAPHVNSPVLITGNHIHTQDVITTVLSTTTYPFFLFFVDTSGSTVDMAIIFETFTAEQIEKNIRKSGIEDLANQESLVIPGLAKDVSPKLEELTGWNVMVGPVCAAELPLFFAHIWDSRARS